MRIEGIRVERFGRLRGFDTGSSALPGLVVVLGPNEAGKSTLFQFLTTVLYGFHPASREGNPYAPWDGEDAAGAVTLRLDGGGCADVERRLLSTPTAKLTVDGGAEDLRNRPVPWVEQMPRTVFRQVFAVTLGELTGLDEETWARVQDRILGSMGASDLVPARRVAADLEQEAGELWRPNRRGKQRIREIQEEILGLRGKRREAMDRDGQLRSMVAELEAARSRLQEARLERHQERLAIDRVQALVPLRGQLRRIDALVEDAAPEDLLDGLPADPAAAFAETSARVGQLEERLLEVTTESDEPRANVAAFGPEASRILERADQIRAFLARSAGLGPDRARLRTLEEETRDLERRLEGAAGQLLATPWNDVSPDALTGVPLPELRERIGRFRSVRDERRVLETALHQDVAEDAPTTPPASLVGSLSVLVSGAALLAVGLVTGDVLPTALGGAGTAAGITFLALWLRARRAGGGGSTPGDRFEVKVRPLREAEEAARIAIADILRNIPVLPSMLVEPDLLLGGGLERIQELLRDRDARRKERAELEARVAWADEEADVLVAALGIDGGGDAETAAHTLEREHRRAERLRDGATSAGRELRRLEREEARLRRELEAAKSARDRLQQRLGEAGGGDLDRGAQQLRRRMEARDRARQLREELERAHPDLDEIRQRIAAAEAAGESWTADDDDLARRKARHEELVEEAEDLARRAEALEQGIARLRKMETVDAVDGEVASLQEEEATLVKRRDRLWVLAQLVRVADRRFREEHQPDLMRRAGEYLSGLTGGRYDRIVADEAGDGDVFYILGPQLPGPVALRHPVSTGTLEQAYLSLRLAMVDHLDQGLERLPLFVDEVFVNWDGERRAQGLDLLARIAESRQLFVFTCHPEVADELKSRGAGVLTLTDLTP